MIAPKTTKPTPREEKLAYEIATDRDDNRCQKCLRGLPINRHHRKGRGVGGMTTAANIVLLCGSGNTGCHGWVTEHPRAAIEQGWACPGYADPTRWPARRYEPTRLGTVRAVWVLYSDDGDYRVISDERAEALMVGDR